jgi:hypothetical protein
VKQGRSFAVEMSIELNSSKCLKRPVYSRIQQGPVLVFIWSHWLAPRPQVPRDYIIMNHLHVGSRESEVQVEGYSWESRRSASKYFAVETVTAQSGAVPLESETLAFTLGAFTLMLRVNSRRFFLSCVLILGLLSLTLEDTLQP